MCKVRISVNSLANWLSHIASILVQYVQKISRFFVTILLTFYVVSNILLFVWFLYFPYFLHFIKVNKFAKRKKSLFNKVNRTKNKFEKTQILKTLTSFYCLLHCFFLQSSFEHKGKKEADKKNKLKTVIIKCLPPRRIKYSLVG